MVHVHRIFCMHTTCMHHVALSASYMTYIHTHSYNMLCTIKIIKISSNRHLVVGAVEDPLDSHQVCKVDRTADASLVDLACVGSVGRARPPFCTWHTWSLIGNAPMVRHNAHNY